MSKAELLGNAKRLDLLSRTLYGLRAYKDLKMRAQHIRLAMHTRYSQTVLSKCFGAWKKHAPEMQMKTVLCEELTNDYRVKLLGKVIRAFRLNSQYRHERKETDSIMTKAIQEISIKKFFKGWRSLAGKRMGLLMFAETF